MKPINPAKYRNRISFQREDEYQTDEGHWVTEWIDVAEIGKVWAEIKSVRGNEFIMAGANAVDVTARITIRYNKRVTDDMKIKYGDRMYDITFINNLEERNIELEILASEIRQ
ncbi:SPP1 family predicted phage head-tail adaptor [Virgibacillus natechei]|uniref:SPP1 family predicted phage head-tail adaptor n=1 Tax=Virgibacillus natechei TaxID=1216297 RepID=A0ABS4IAM3_9BACI|nr:phage head closure protein [Virgibacillus natechei]MBP1967979.1 SPP1 family predicted phage head-tail adaptor [Virgibacillus natechei]UZD14735.1 phage head closure protein [Virgibacillus natechei]